MDGADVSSAAPFIGDDDLLQHLWRMSGERRIVVHMQLGVLCVAGGDRRSLARHARALVRHMLNVDRGSRAALRA